jgi:glutamate dehydrogenase
MNKDMPQDLRSQTLALVNENKPADAADQTGALISAWLGARRGRPGRHRAASAGAGPVGRLRAGAQRSAPGARSPRCATPTGGGMATALLILNDDMPYLVDSFVMALRKPARGPRRA